MSRGGVTRWGRTEGSGGPGPRRRGGGERGGAAGARGRGAAVGSARAALPLPLQSAFPRRECSRAWRRCLWGRAPGGCGGEGAGAGLGGSASRWFGSERRPLSERRRRGSGSPPSPGGVFWGCVSVARLPVVRLSCRARWI